MLLARDIEATFLVKGWINSARISDGFLIRGIAGKQLNNSMDPGQVSRIFKSIALKADLDP